MATSEQTGIMTNRLYEVLKWIAQILLPALGALYFGLDQIWHFGNGVEVVGTITVIDLFLGGLLKASSSAYYKNGDNFDGDVVVEPEDGGVKVGIAADRPLEDVVDDPGKHSVEFKIVRKG